jgi:pimeloyl-ACP methyl ester carboxylesterase
VLCEPLAFRIAKSVPSLALDIYLPDHRGTGKSSFAACGSITAQTAATCAAKFPHLDGLTTTDAAKDLDALIDATRTASQQVFVFGGSWGTYWAQRYLQIRPDQATAVILEGTVPAVGGDYANFDKNFDNTAHAVLALCQADATCSAKLGPDPVAQTSQALAALEAGQCPIPVQALNGMTIRKMFGLFLGAHYFERLLLAAAAYRALRCNAADQQWLKTVFAYVPGQGPWTYWGFSNVVSFNITLSELWPSNPSLADLLAQEKTMLVVDGSPPSWAAAAPYWPTYPHDAYYGSWPSSTVPILVLQGTLDPKTPYGALVKSHYSGPTYYVELPKAAHGALEDENAPMVDATTCGCGRQVMQSFIADPTKAPDTSCIAGMAPLDWGNPPAWWLARVGITDLWENP